MLLVTGGWDMDPDGYGPDGVRRYGVVDSMDTFDPLLGSWTASGAKLPKPMQLHKVVNINGRVLIFGGYAFQHEFYDDIIEYHPEEDTMTPVGHMTAARYKHAVSVVKADDYLQWCQ